MRIDEPQFNHNGGAINFGHDGMLYISLGDGGGADDVDGQPFIGGPLVGHGNGNGQNPANVLGSILRVDPSGSNSANGQYGIPADNPFVDMQGYAAETFAYGFRNPFRFSFDMATGDLYTGDVGQNDLEEVDVVVAGGNYGWNVKEGSFCFDPNGPAPGFAFAQHPCPDEPTGLIDPVAEYNTSDSLTENEDGRAVVGGFVYRGSSIPGLVGRYIFGDFSQFTESGVNNEGRLFYLNKKNIVKDNRIKTSKIFEFTLYGQDELGFSLLGFGQDASGELYVLANEVGTPFGDTGVVLRITRAP
jgi:glucose/arabinose dehydrogenase